MRVNRTRFWPRNANRFLEIVRSACSSTVDTRGPVHAAVDVETRRHSPASERIGEGRGSWFPRLVYAAVPKAPSSTPPQACGRRRTVRSTTDGAAPPRTHALAHAHAHTRTRTRTRTRAHAPTAAHRVVYGLPTRNAVTIGRPRVRSRGLSRGGCMAALAGTGGTWRPATRNGRIRTKRPPNL